MCKEKVKKFYINTREPKIAWINEGEKTKFHLWIIGNTKKKIRINIKDNLFKKYTMIFKNPLT